MFCARVANGIEEPVEPFECKNMKLTRCVTLVSVECDESASHAGLSRFFELRKTHVPEEPNLGKIHNLAFPFRLVLVGVHFRLQLFGALSIQILVLTPPSTIVFILS